MSCSLYTGRLPQDSLSPAPGAPSHGGSYWSLLSNGNFEAFLWTQFLGAFNDNLYKMIVSLVAVRAAAEAGGGKYLALAGAVFVLPFLLFAGYAGQLADRYSKSKVRR